uniref:Uncharacterized protein n=1 Tax=Nelumbo nucifera TaxID=4432 RepID=A0A822ZJH2_NELNU|nr:TPA_asm: hypothetical protein HUJ06_001769 [Nelumbo nucifera]
MLLCFGPEKEGDVQSMQKLRKARAMEDKNSYIMCGSGANSQPNKADGYTGVTLNSTFEFDPSMPFTFTTMRRERMNLDRIISMVVSSFRR